MDVRLLDSLTPTERRVLRLVHHSRKTDAIAPLVGLSPHTVDQHIKSARGKLGGMGRYVAADLLREAEGLHPPSVGNQSQGMADPAAVVPSVDPADAVAERSIVTATAEPLVNLSARAASEQVDLLDEWLRQRTALSRLVLVLVATFLMLLLIVSAPLLAAQMGRIGQVLYR